MIKNIVIIIVLSVVLSLVFILKRDADRLNYSLLIALAEMVQEKCSVEVLVKTTKKENHIKCPIRTISSYKNISGTTTILDFYPPDPAKFTRMPDEEFDETPKLLLDGYVRISDKIRE